MLGKKKLKICKKLATLLKGHQKREVTECFRHYPETEVFNGNDSKLTQM